MCVLICYANFPAIKKIEQDMIKNVIKFICKVPLLSDFS